MKFLFCLTTIIGFLSATFGAAIAATLPESTSFSAAGRVTQYGSVPLSFDVNEGQTNHRVRFMAHGPGYSLFLTAHETVLALRTMVGALAGKRSAAFQATVVRLKLLGSDPKVKVTGEQELPGKSNYFIGRDPSGWHTNVPTYAQVRYRGIYPRVDLVYYGRQGELENDFIVAAGGDARQVRFRIEGAKRVTVNRAGELLLETAAGEVALGRPEAYQRAPGAKHPVEVRYARLGRDEFGFDVGAYKRSEPLIIDPVLNYATYLGGSGGDVANAIAVDSAGNAYVSGMTGSINFPVKSPEQGTPGGAGDAFVTKLNAAGSGLIYSTYLGGSGVDAANAIALDSSGSVYIVGNTSSVNFPVTSGAVQTTFGGVTDVFIAKLSPAGSSLSYSTYLGGTATDLGQGVAVDASGNAYVTGSSQSPDFPIKNALQIGNDGCSVLNNVETCSADAFVAEINPTGTALVYSTYLGGSGADGGNAIAVDSSGNAYVGGYTLSSDFPTQNALQSTYGGGSSDGFVAELNAAGSSLVFSTYLGGKAQDYVSGLTLDASTNIYVTGMTQSADFPTTPNVFQSTYGGDGDAFAGKLSAGGSLLVYSTFIGGSGADQGNAIAVDATGSAVVVGFTQSSDFPTVDPSQRILGISGAGTCGAGVCSDAFITKLNPSGKAVYSTYLGGSGADFALAVAVDSSGVPYAAGGTASSNFPATVGVPQGSYAGAGSSGNAFVVKIGPNDDAGVALNPQIVDFGNQTLNVASPAQTVTLINAGSAPLQISTITASGDYAETNNCGTVIPAGSGTCTINIAFTPKTAGPTTDQVTISDSAAGSPHHITVTGNGVTGGGGVLTLTPSSLVFSTQSIGSTSAPQTVELINSSQTAITLSTITISGDFTETNNCGLLPSVLNPAASCSVSIVFTPTASGSRTGSLTITDNASGGTQSVSLSGTGGAPFTLSATTRSSVILIGTTSTTFTVSASAPNSFTSSISLSCSSSGATCTFNPTSIYAGQTSTLTLSGLSATTADPLNFTVTGTSGSYNAALSLSVFLADFTLSATPPLDTINAGQTANYTVTVTPSNGFNAVVLLSCTGTVPNDATCTFTPPGITLNGTTPSTVAVSVSTTTQQQSSRGWPRRPFPGAPGGIWGLAAATITLLCGILGFGRRLPREVSQGARWALVAVGLILLTITGVSCNQYAQSPIGAPVVIGTPSGNYTLTLTGTLGSNGSVTRSTTVNLSVGPG